MKKKPGDKCIERFISECKLLEKDTSKAEELGCATCETGQLLKAHSLSILSHELLTPLSGFIGMTELALEHELDWEARQLVFLANIAAQDLLNVINDVLLLSQIVSGNIPLLADRVRPSKLTDAIWPDLLKEAQAKRLTLKLNLSEDMPPLITLDLHQMQRVMKILVGNAIKFTERGSISVRVERLPSEARGLHICVADTGIGIAPEKLDSIFAPFMQADSGLSRRYNGLGIGLTIAWRLIDLMGGELAVNSELGKGSSFHVFLP